MYARSRIGPKIVPWGTPGSGYGYRIGALSVQNYSLRTSLQEVSDPDKSYICNDIEQEFVYQSEMRNFIKDFDEVRDYEISLNPLCLSGRTSSFPPSKATADGPAVAALSETDRSENYEGSMPGCRTPPPPTPLIIHGHELEVNYLVNYGYMDQQFMQTVQLQGEDSLKEAISLFQEFANITVTGKLDDDTTRMMTRPRCGVPDMNGTNSHGMARRRRRFVLRGSKWAKKNLTWSLADADYTSSLRKEDVDEAITQAFQLWQDQTSLTFNRVDASNQADIVIKFASFSHGDREPFDGPGNTLAHAFPPRFGGDAHFDESERWAVKTDSGTI
ncbi:MMP25 [Branchiostoma lanceolatum]|uniref:MMP25 protein n=1 Tax=Branchiostoma lanceolatum TaxID=7740 RepID=A0A8J9ZZG9_BRALA|nr:MMP25 [Branchiostoma lanceolatum]